MKEFFKYVLATIVGIVISCVVLFVLFLAFVTAIMSSSNSDKKAVISSNTVLHVSMNYPITERTSKNPFEDLNNFSLGGNDHLGLNDILANIKSAKENDNIKGIYLDVSMMQAGWASIEEIRNALVDFKKSGKFIIAYSEVYTQGAYYIASVANKVYVNPEGLIDFRGFSSETMFFKGTLEKLGIEPQVIKVGTYKSAVEPFILDKMSDANRKQVTSFVNSMYDHFLSNISASRKVNTDSLRAIANGAKIQTAQDAVTYKLADGLRYKDQVLDELRKLTNIASDKEVRSVSIEQYGKPSEDETTAGSDRIAVVYANGEIVSGEGSDEVMGSERISRAIRRARTDKKIKALVLRVNSPGGSALASDVIWREVVLTRKVKPVIVSMGDVAASGGYYIACGADLIIAEPNTITGSIGVFGIIPNMQKFFNDKLGITFDRVKTGQYADLGDVSRPLTDGEKLLIQKSVNAIYASFTKKVADGRKKSQTYIDSIGQGRVWTGTEALKNGLVDRLGNIHDAVQAAASKAKLRDYKIVEYPSQKDPIYELLGGSTDKIKTWFTKMELGDNYHYYQQAKAALNTSGIQARMPYTISIK